MLSRNRVSKKVTLYSSPTCGFCQLEKAFLDEKGVSYTDYDVLENPTCARQMVAISGQMGTPVTVVEGSGQKRVIVGFNKAVLVKLLELED